MGCGPLVGDMDSPKKKDGLCEGERERVGHVEQVNFMVRSPDYIGRRQV
jgi:hypothetical protein